MMLLRHVDNLYPQQMFICKTRKEMYQLAASINWYMYGETDYMDNHIILTTSDSMRKFLSISGKNRGKKKFSFFVILFTHGDSSYMMLNRNNIPLVTKGSVDFDRNENMIIIPYRTSPRKNLLFKKGPESLQLYSCEERGMFYEK